MEMYTHFRSLCFGAVEEGPKSLASPIARRNLGTRIGGVESVKSNVGTLRHRGFGSCYRVSVTEL